MKSAAKLFAASMVLAVLAGCQTAGGATGACAPGDPKRVGH